MATTFTYEEDPISMPSCATTASSNLLTVTAAALGSWGLAIGATVVHANIPASTTILSFNSTTQAVMSANATATGAALTVVATNPAIINIDDIPSIVKTGGDIYNINGPTLLVDQHSRFGLNNGNAAATTATSMGTVTLSATKGGKFNIDARYVRMIPYNTGSGTIPALNSLVTQGGASGELMCVYSSLTAAPVVSGAIPASGWIMIKTWNSVAYAAGAITLSGITATATGADIVGFLEIMGDDASTVNVNRLNEFNITGAFYSLGTTSGSASQTFQIPNHGTLRHFAGVFIETAVASGVYEFYVNGGTTTTAGSTVATGNEVQRGKSVWINNAGLVTIGNSGGTGLNGYVPVTGLKVVIPNVFLCCNTALLRNAEIIPSATIATRYDFSTAGGGVVNIDKANMCWYPSFLQPYSVNITNTGIIDALLIQECASPVTLTRVGVGNKPTTNLVAAPLTLTTCFAGGTISNCVFQRVVTGGNNSTASLLTDLDGFTFSSNRWQYAALRAHTLPVTISATRVANTTFTSNTIIDGQVSIATCTNVTITGLTYIGAIVGTTSATNPCTGIILTANCLNVVIDGFNIPVTNWHPYTGLINIGVAGCTNTKIRNIGTRASPLNMGSATASGVVVTISTGGAATNTLIQRVYTLNTRTGFITADNSSTKLLMENCYDDYANAVDVSAVLNMIQKGNANTKAYTATQGIYGTHWIDHFQSTTAGRLVILMNEPTTLTAAQVSLTNGAAFTSAGGLYMPVVGQTATFEMPYFALGHTQFTNSAAVMAGGTVGNYSFEYAIDTGSGFSALTASAYTAAALGTALNALGAINPATGFKLRLKVSTTTANTTAITSVYIPTTSTAVAQDNQYPLDTNTVTFTGLPASTDMVVLTAGTTTVLYSVDAASTFTYTYSGAQTVDVGFIKEGYVPLYIRNLSLTTTDSSIPVAMSADRNFI